MELGIANRVVPHEELLSTAEQIARRIMENSPASIRHIKEATIRGIDLPIEERIKLARVLARRCILTEDAREGLRAFVEERAPVWTGC